MTMIKISHDSFISNFIIYLVCIYVPMGYRYSKISILLSLEMVTQPFPKFHGTDIRNRVSCSLTIDAHGVQSGYKIYCIFIKFIKFYLFCCFH